jgi:hypothetical protein
VREAPDDQPVLHLFQGYGIELEYMLVDATTLAVLPRTDKVLEAVTGKITSDYEEGAIAWSNELVSHVIELKTNGPADHLRGLAALFQQDIRRINDILQPLGGRLMPTAMHPLMDPQFETTLWPHDYSPVYQAFNRIFDCRGHGWSNLQSVHVNLPFADDDEFGRLHAAIRLVLPILPALVASSPVVEGRVDGRLDHRLEFYRVNAQRIPSVSGHVIPEPAFTRERYESDILQRIYEDLQPFDPEGTLRNEWINARGAIARFDRMAIEIRVLDIQECPQADLATTALIVAVIRALVDESWAGFDEQRGWQVQPLAALLQRVVTEGEHCRIEDPAYLALFGITSPRAMSAQDLWKHLRQQVLAASEADHAEWKAALDVILDAGPLARRILAALGSQADRARILDVYRDLCSCLERGELFRADG